MLGLMQCGALVSSCVESLLEPALNKDILSMQGNLVAYKDIKSDWPQDVRSLKLFSDSIGKPISSRFEELEINRNLDSVYVRYFLRYAPLDSSKYQYMKGDFVMVFSSDSTIAIRHKAFEGKTKDGSSVSSNRMDPKGLQQTRTR